MDEVINTQFGQACQKLLDSGWKWEEIDRLYVLRVFHVSRGESTGFGPYEIQRLLFLRWLVGTGRLEA